MDGTQCTLRERQKLLYNGRRGTFTKLLDFLYREGYHCTNDKETKITPYALVFTSYGEFEEGSTYSSRGFHVYYTETSEKLFFMAMFLQQDLRNLTLAAYDHGRNITEYFKRYNNVFKKGNVLLE